MHSYLAALVVAAGLTGQIEVELHRMPTAASTSGSQLMLSAAREKYPELAQLEFEPPQAIVLSSQEILEAVMAIPTADAARTLDGVLSGATAPQRGAPIGMIMFLNLLPEGIADQTECYHFPWKNDTVRKLAAMLITVQRSERGELRFQYWGPGDRRLCEVLTPAAPRREDRFLEFDYVKNDLEFRFFGAYVYRQRLRACLFNY